MICPHCSKETDGYVGFKSENIALQNVACADQGVTTTWVNTNVAAGNPMVIGNPVTALNPAGCANVGANIHYHVLSSK